MKVKTTELKQMIYGGPEGLLYFETDREDGFEIAIINIRGSHPCAYVNVPKTFRDKFGDPILDYDAWFADGAHGGFTYAGKELRTKDFKREGFWLGWDYAHAGDYTCLVDMYGNVINYNPIRDSERKYTTEEILEHAYEVINMLDYDEEAYNLYYR